MNEWMDGSIADAPESSSPARYIIMYLVCGKEVKRNWRARGIVMQMRDRINMGGRVFFVVVLYDGANGM